MRYESVVPRSARERSMFLRVELFASKLIHTYFGYASNGPKNMKLLAKRN